MIRSDDRFAGVRSANDGTTGTGLPEQGNGEGTAGTGQPEHAICRDKTSEAGLLGQDSQEGGRSGLIAPTDHPGQHDNKSRKDRRLY